MKSLKTRLQAAFASASLVLAAALPANANTPSHASFPEDSPADKAPPVTAGPPPFRVIITPAPVVAPTPPAPSPAPAAVVQTDRYVEVYDEINDEMAHKVRKELLELDAKSPGTPIEMRINSGGGSVPAGLMIYDTMQSLKSPVATVCESSCSSMAGVLLLAGAPGMRSALPNALVMLHELSTDLPEGTYSQNKSWQKRIDIRQDQLMTIIARHTGQNKQQVAEKLVGIDDYQTADKAVKMGLIDKVQGVQQPEPKKAPAVKKPSIPRRWGP